MKIHAALCALCLLATAGAGATPFELRCEQEMLPHFDVDVRHENFRVFNNVSSQMLNNRAIHAYSTNLMLGMTEITSRLEVAISGQSLLDTGAGRECLAPHIAVDLLLKPIAVYVAREFPRQSCPYRTILAHEMEHVALYEAALPKIEATVRGELQRRFAGKPLYAPAGTSMDRLQDDIDVWLRPLVKAELAKVEVAQQALDSEEEIFRLSHACNGELALTLSTAM